MFLRRSLVHISYWYMIFLFFMSVHLGACPPPPPHHSKKLATLLLSAFAHQKSGQMKMADSVPPTRYTKSPPLLTTVLQTFTTVLQTLATVLQTLATVLQTLATVLQTLATVLQTLATVLQTLATICGKINSQRNFEHVQNFFATRKTLCDKLTIKTVCELVCNLLRTLTKSWRIQNSPRSQAFAAQSDTPLKSLDSPKRAEFQTLLRLSPNNTRVLYEGK